MRRHGDGKTRGRGRQGNWGLSDTVTPVLTRCVSVSAVSPSPCLPVPVSPFLVSAVPRPSYGSHSNATSEIAVSGSVP
jgi:hypothetical protein